MVEKQGTSHLARNFELETVPNKRNAAQLHIRPANPDYSSPENWRCPGGWWTTRRWLLVGRCWTRCKAN